MKTTKSVVVIGKGPSVLQNTKEFIDSFDEVAICNFPPINGFEQYIGTRATHHFLNIHDPNPYSKDILNNLGLKKMFNTHPQAEGESNLFSECFPDNDVIYYKFYGQDLIPRFQEEHGFDPSCATIAFDYFVKKEEYYKIALVGFDCFKVGEKGYYFPVEQTQESHRYLYRADGSTPFDEKGYRVQSNPHDSKSTEKFVHDMVKLYNKELIWKTKT